MTVTPLKGDRSAFDVTNHPAKHASDLEADTPIHHVPAGSDTGDTLIWDGTKWTPGPPSSSVNDLDDLADVVLTTPADDEVLTYDSATQKWINQTPSEAANLVDSVFGRTGDVVAAANDYNAGQVEVTPVGNIASTDVQAALEELDSEKSATGHSHSAPDASVVTYTPVDNTDWDTSADPGNTDDALDQLAARTKTLETTPPGSADASDVTYTPAVSTDWDGDADPGNADDAFDQLADRVTTLEGAGGGTATAIQATTSALDTTEGAVKWDTNQKVLKLYDTQRERTISPIGWQPFAVPIGWQASPWANAGNTINANGGTWAIPIPLYAPMLLESVSVRITTTGSVTVTWGWDIYVQYLNNGNSGENSLTRLVACNADETYTASAAGFRTIVAASYPVFIPPGIVFLCVQNRHATQNFNINTLGGTDNAAVICHSKTTTNPNGSTLDFVAATWTKQINMANVRLNGRVFGDTAIY